MTDEIEVTTVDGVATPDAVPDLDGMPILGYGTWQLDDPETCVEAVSTALDAGVRHVDTARAYGNERLVGDAIEQSDVDREEVFLATKVWISDLGRSDAVEAAYGSLDRLGTDYLDLLYVHWPARTYDPAETLAAFDQLVEEGVTERVGVSNFQPEQLAEACDLADAPVFANQFECHPLLPQEPLVEACRERGVHPVAYSPLARGRVGEIPAIADVAAANGVTPAQVSLAWLRQRGVAAVPKAATPEHIHDNWDSLTLRLDDADLAKIDGIDERDRQVDPGFAPWN